jgi:hypothetical protein
MHRTSVPWAARVRHAARTLGIVAAGLALAACSMITPSRMAPDDGGGPDRKVAMRLQVGAVTGARPTFFGGAPFPSNEQLREALVATLEKAAVFTAVSTTAGEAELTVTILTQDQQGILPTTARMVANYKVAARDGAVLWSETYDTSFSAGEFSGATRTVKAQEGAVRENLKAFVQGLKARWRQP